MFSWNRPSHLTNGSTVNVYGVGGFSFATTTVPVVTVSENGVVVHPVLIHSFPQQTHSLGSTDGCSCVPVAQFASPTHKRFFRHQFQRLSSLHLVLFLEGGNHTRWDVNRRRMFFLNHLRRQRPTRARNGAWFLPRLCLFKCGSERCFRRSWRLKKPR